MDEVIKVLEGLLILIASSIILVIAGIVYFMLTLFTVKVGSGLLGFETILEANYAVLAASMLVAAGILGSAIQGGKRS